MSYDSKLYIKQHYEQHGLKRVNNLKMVEFDEFVQVYVASAGKWAQIRLDKNAVQQMIEYLKNVEI